jgi:nitrogen fixation-related uncharacterized protein
MQSRAVRNSTGQAFGMGRFSVRRRPLRLVAGVCRIRFLGARGMMMLILATVYLAGVARGELPKVKRSAPPAWVENVPVDLSGAKNPAIIDGGWNRLLVERQVNVAQGVRYGHFANQLLTESAVENGGRISVAFNPAYEVLSFHRLMIHRKGKAMDRLAKQEIKVLQREARLDRNLYDGRLSAEIILEDIRVGDVVEFAYSITGRNPIFEGRYLDGFYASTNEPAKLLRFRVMWPAGRQLHFKSHGHDLPPVITPHKGWTEYLWEKRDLPAIVSDGEVPTWFEPLDWVQLTEFDSWADVARLETRICQVPATIPEELENEVRRIAAMETEQARVLAALRYVQDNIRYLGMESGENAHKPYPIETILARRFGDCKDKSMLLCTILRRLGFEAYPALVDTEERQAVASRLPTPGAFDHMVVQLRFHGTEIWLDPTDRNQGGSLEKIFFPAYGQSLVVAPDTTALTPVRAAGFPDSSREIVESFDFKDFTGTATMRVRATFRGKAADDQRSYHADTGLDAVRKSNINFYADLYPHVEATAPPSFRDEREGNILTEDESYLVSGFWKPSDDEKKDDRITASFTAQYARDLVAWPNTSVRTMPYALPHPRKLVHVIEINLPRKANFDSEHVVVDDPAFLFDYTAATTGTKLTLRFSYESRMDHVPAAAISKYLENVKRMRRVLSYQILVRTKWGNAEPVVAQRETKIAAPDNSVAAAGTKPSTALTTMLGVVLIVGALVAGFIVWSIRTGQKEADEPAPLHRCVICGETERSDPSLEFRVALNGADYCKRHLPPPLPPSVGWEGGGSKA